MISTDIPSSQEIEDIISKKQIETSRESTAFIINALSQRGLGKIMDVLGRPVNKAGSIDAEDLFSIHRKAPSYERQTGSPELLETGLKDMLYSRSNLK